MSEGQTLLERWTRGVVRHRLPVLLAWALVLVAGAVAAGRLGPHLATSFAVPGAESERARTVLADAFGERPDGSFTIVARVPRTSDPAARRAFAEVLDRAAATVPGASAGEVRDGTRVLYGTVGTALELQDAKQLTDDVRRAVRAAGRPAGLAPLVTGQPAIQHDLEPVVAGDLERGRLVAIGVALVVLLAVLGFSVAVLVPFAFAACSISLSLVLLLVLAQRWTPATYVTSLAELIGLGLAIDYSLLVLLRQREELAGGGSVEDAIVRTLRTAGRTAVLSGTAVAIGLALLLAVPVPFIRSLGIAGLLVPLTSIVALLALQPALLSVMGRRGLERRARTPAAEGQGVWARVARTAMRRPGLTLALGCAALLIAALPALRLELTPGSLTTLPLSLESTSGYEALRRGIGPGVVTPTSVIVDTGRPGGARREDVNRAIDRLGDRLFEDFGLVALGSGTKEPYVDPELRYTRLVAAGREDVGAPATRAFVERLRTVDVPAARLPADVAVLVGGAPAQGVDFLARVYDAFPWLVLGVLLVTALVLARAFRSLALPVKAVLLNVLTVGATYGLLVLLFQDGHGERLGLTPGEIEGWVPLFLFAIVFGLSMDYEVFIVSRVREAWDETGDGALAVELGLERTGRVVTAAALVMLGAFAGFAGGRIAGLQQLGVGLSLAVLLDATLVRMMLVPAAMTVLGRWNWWLPTWAARTLRVPPAPLAPRPAHTRSSAH